MSFSKIPPKTSKDKALAKKHLRDEVVYDKRHAKDHAKVKNKAGYSYSYNESHEKGHLRDMKKAKTKLRGSYTGK